MGPEIVPARVKRVIQNDGFCGARNLSSLSDLATFRHPGQTLHSRSHHEDSGSSKQLAQLNFATITNFDNKGIFINSDSCDFLSDLFGDLASTKTPVPAGSSVNVF